MSHRWNELLRGRGSGRIQGGRAVGAARKRKRRRKVTTASRKRNRRKQESCGKEKT